MVARKFETATPSLILYKIKSENYIDWLFLVEWVENAPVLAKSIRHVPNRLVSYKGQIIISATVTNHGNLKDIHLEKGLFGEVNNSIINGFHTYNEKNNKNYQMDTTNIADLKFYFYYIEVIPSTRYLNKNFSVSGAAEEHLQYMKGVKMMEKGMYEMAEYHFNRAIEQNKRDIDAYYNRGVIKYHNEDLEGACTDWEKAYYYGDYNAFKLLQSKCSDSTETSD